MYMDTSDRTTTLQLLRMQHSTPGRQAIYTAAEGDDGGYILATLHYCVVGDGTVIGISGEYSPLLKYFIMGINS